MNARAISLFVGAALVLPVRASFADDGEEEAPARFELVDFASIPKGALPSPPAEGSAPKVPPSARALDLKIENVDTGAKPSKKRKRIHSKRKGGRSSESRVVEITPAAPSLGLFYAPSTGVGEIDGESGVRMACGQGLDPSPLRREKLTLDREGHARLQIDDLWFDPESCSVRSGSSSVVELGAVAHDNGKPWLFAVRSDTSVTFVMPRSNELSAEAMVGAPLTIRGAFTRVTLPLGRWGAGSMLGALPALAIEDLGPTKVDGATQIEDKPSGAPDQGPTELLVEVVQTMTEKQPTLLVRTREPRAVASTFEGRE